MDENRYKIFPGHKLQQLTVRMPLEIAAIFLGKSAKTSEPVSFFNQWQAQQPRLPALNWNHIIIRSFSCLCRRKWGGPFPQKSLLEISVECHISSNSCFLEKVFGNCLVLTEVLLKFHQKRKNWLFPYHLTDSSFPGRF